MCRWHGLRVKSGHMRSLDTHTQRFVKQCDNRHSAHSSADRWTHRPGHGAAALRHSCTSAQPQGGPGRVLCPKAALAWVDQLPVPPSHPVLEMLAPCSPPWLPIILPVYAFISSGDAHCFSTGNTLQPLLYAPLYSYLSGPHYILTGQVQCFRSEHTLPLRASTAPQYLDRAVIQPVLRC